MRVQLEGENNIRAGTIIITTLPHSYAHCAPSRFSQNAEQTWNLLMIIINQPDSAVLYSWVIINDNFSKLCCTLRCYSCNQTSDCWATPITIIVHAHGAGTIQGQGLFRSAQAWWQVWNNSKTGRIHTQGNTVLKTPTLVVDNQLPQCRLFVSLMNILCGAN